MSENIEFKDQLYRDLWYEKTPKRVPITVWIDYVYALQYCKMNLLRDQYSADRMFEAVDKIAPEVDSDSYPMSVASNIVAMKITGNRGWVMGSEGFLQHPNFAPMKDTEYDRLINDYDNFYEEIDIRGNSEYECSEEERNLVKLRAQVSNMRYYGTFAVKQKEIEQKYQRSCFEHWVGMTGGPFDNLANGFRSFSGALNDIRRHPEEVLQAVRMFTDRNKAVVDHAGGAGEEGARLFMPLHMATFMREKDFQKFWWPFFKEVLDECAKTDHRIWMFCEDKWDRYMDYLTETPKGTLLEFEGTDPKLAKEKLGKDHIICGFYPISVLQSGTIEETKEEVHKLLDIVAPNGGYIFKTDKDPICMADAKLENIKAMISEVKSYGVY